MTVNITVEEDIGWILLGGLAERLKRGWNVAFVGHGN
jgi:hypothetical protein